MPLLRNGKLEQQEWVQHVSGEKAQADRFVALSDFLSDPKQWLELKGPWLAVIQPDDDLEQFPAELLAQLQLGIAFPVFTDGRGYSHARHLRQLHQFEGELIATGDVRRDQIDFMSQVGIDSFECAADINVADWQKALVELRVQVSA